MFIYISVQALEINRIIKRLKHKFFYFIIFEKNLNFYIMRKIVTLIVVLFISTLNAQETYDKSKLGNISVVTKKGKSQGDIYLDLKLDGSLGISLDKIDKKKFIDYLKKINTKFKEWTEVAKKNNVNEYRKDYDEAYFSGYFKYYDKWKFGRCRMISTFKVEEGKPSGYVFVPKIPSSNNEYMKSESWLFYVNDNLISEFEELLSDEAIDKFIISKTSNEILFN